MTPMLLYIDPGTGSMLFAAMIGIAAAAVFFLKKLWMKAKFVLTGGRADTVSGTKIPIVLFNESRRYWNLFESVCGEFEKRGEELAYWTADPEDPALQKDYAHVHCTFIGEGNRGYAKLNFMNARVCLATTPGLDVYQWKRSRNTDWYAHIFHAVDEGTSYRMFGMDYYDAVLLSGSFQEKYIRMLEEMRGLPAKELPVVGSPYLDAMQRKLDALRTEEAEKAAAAAAADTAAGTAGAAPAAAARMRTVLLAPSWGESGILSRFGADIIEALLATGYRIVVRPHPQSFISEKEIIEPLQKRFGDRIEWNTDSDNFRILNEADILISDFSGVVFDFALVFGKPVIYADTSFDPAPYDAAWIDEERWCFRALAQFGVRLERDQFPELKRIIDDAIDDPSYAEAREGVKRTAWQNIGLSAERTADYLIKKRDELTGYPAAPDGPAREKPHPARQARRQSV